LSKHHFVPKLILKRFKSDSGELFYFDLKKPHRPIISRNPDSIFYERSLNTLSDRSESREQQFAEKIDTPFDALLSRIEARSGAGRRLDLSSDDRTLLACFLYYQLKRRPSIVSDLLEEDADNDIPSHDISLLSDIQKQPSINTDDARNFIHDVRALTLVHLSPEVVENIIKRGVCFARNLTDQKFIVGARPITRHVLTIGGPRRSNVYEVDQLVFPVGSDFLMLIGPIELDGQVLELASSAEVRSLNKKIALQSSMIAGPKKSDVEALSRIMKGSSSDPSSQNRI